MIEKYCRPFLQTWIVDPIAIHLPASVPANVLTLFAGVIGVSAFLLLYSHYIYFAVLAIIISGFLDILDGSVARYRQQQSALGSVLDIVTDRLVECSIILGLFALAPQQRGWLCLLMLASCLLCITCFLVIGIFTENQTHKSFHYSPGLIERAEAFLFFIAMILWPTYFTLIASIFIILVIITAILHISGFILHMQRN